jgi:hypothetical protein
VGCLLDQERSCPSLVDVSQAQTGNVDCGYRCPVESRKVFLYQRHSLEWHWTGYFGRIGHECFASGYILQYFTKLDFFKPHVGWKTYWLVAIVTALVSQSLFVLISEISVPRQEFGLEDYQQHVRVDGFENIRFHELSMFG